MNPTDCACGGVLRPGMSAEHHRAVKKAREALADYGEHAKECARSYFEAGEPTDDGGYRQRFRGVWYEAKPVDRTPKCDCGLDATIAALDVELGEKP